MAKPQKTSTTPATHDHSDHDDHSGHNHDHSHSAPQARHPEIGESKQINFSIPWTSVDETFQKIVRGYQPHVKTAGFRKGKVPLKMVEQMVGAERLYQETVEKLVPAAYVEAVKKADAKPIGDPEIHPVSMEMGKDWEFHAHIAEKPEVKLGKYQEIVKKAASEFEKKAKEDKSKETKKPAKTDKGDKTESVAAEPKEPVKTAEEIEQDLKDQKLNAILAAVRDSIKPVIPELLIKQEAQHSIENLERQLTSYNIQKASYYKSMGKTEDDVRAEFVGRALASWQLEVIIDAIATDQKIEAPDTEIDEFVKKNYPEDQKISATQRVQIQSMLRKQKVFEHLLESSLN